LPEELAAQIVSPVMWVPSVQTMQAAGVSQVVEFGPGRVLTGLVRRIDRAIGIRNVSTAEEARA
ncbi:MAG: malonyl CoA-acyl carrier protein transacylase, partial [Dehalococcoidia bacterium]|nr:malonyl CoA-acyl carrier protein transacylase [Dehalococcoidia bacterium]